VAREHAFQVLARDVADLLTDDWCVRFRARIIAQARTTIDNAETFAISTSELLGNRRGGDQIGAMLAGAYSLTSKERIELDQAKAWLARQDLEAERATSVDTDARGCLDMILQSQIQVDGGGRRRSVAELLMGANTHRPVVESEPVMAQMGDEANLTLARHGLKFRADGGFGPAGWWVAISDSHREIAAMLRGTPFARAWKTYIRRVPGARTRGSEWFAGATMRVTEVPWAECFK
jgi:putative DNA primase/helicase